MGLPTLQDRREKGDPTSMYKTVNGIEKLDKQNLVRMEEKTRQMTGQTLKADHNESVFKGHYKVQFFT